MTAVVQRAGGVAALLARGTRALAADGDLGTGRRWFDVAYQEAERAKDAEAMAQAVLGLSGLWVHEYRTATAATSLDTRLRRTLARVDPGSASALRLRIRLAGEASYRNGDPAEILAALDEARSAGQPLAVADALSIAHHCLPGPEHGPLRRSLAAELIEQSLFTGRRTDLLMGLLLQTVDLYLDADPHAGRSLAELRTLLAQQDHEAIGFAADAVEVMLAIRAGQLDRAESLAHACAQRGTAAGDVNATWWHGSHMVAIRWYQGRLAEMAPRLADLVHSPTLSTVDNSVLAALAVATALAGDRPRAAAALAALTDPGLNALPRSNSWLATMNGIVEAAYLLGDADTAAAAYDLLLPYAHLPVLGGPAIVCFGSVRHALGVASLTTGHLERAVDHLAAAVRHNYALSHLPAAVFSRRRLAEALLRRGAPGDITDSQREAAAAEADAYALGLMYDADPDAGDPAPALSIARRGRDWRIVWGHREAVVTHRVGMLHLAVLVANPSQEIDAIDLVGGLSALGTERDMAGLSSQPMLDRMAVQEYRLRLARLSQEIDELSEAGDADRAAQARQERDWLLSELASATGLGGRARRFTDDRERARIAVGRAIRRAVEQICAADAAIGEYLARTVRTGVRCAYWPA